MLIRLSSSRPHRPGIAALAVMATGAVLIATSSSDAGRSTAATTRSAQAPAGSQSAHQIDPNGIIAWD